MALMLATVVAAIVSFAATNIDDIFLLTFFFGHGVSPWRVTTGQFLGFSALVLVSLAGYAARFAVPASWIGLLGIVPILIGIKKLAELRRRDEPETTSVRGFSTLSVAAVTFSNGGDNIGIYAPLFASVDLHRLLVTIFVFFLLLALWCLLGYFLGNISMVRRVIERYGHALVPFALIGLGIFILVHSGVF